MLDLWAREHYKSTIITYGKTIQDILSSHGDEPLPEWKGREVTVGIFSHTRPIAKGFLRQIMEEFRNNERLKDLFPDILWKNPKREAPKWSEDDGIVVRRKGNPKESTIEAWGIVDAQPTSKHFFIRVYDDVVTKVTVGSPQMILKTIDSWEHSLDLGMRGGLERYIGTRYRENDPYREMIRRNVAKVRKHPATDTGMMKGTPVLLTQTELEEKLRKQGPYNFACQQLQNPLADEKQGFKEEWLKYYAGKKSGDGMNIYILVDPANDKKKKSDYTAMWVIGANSDGLIYVLDMVRDRYNLEERTDKLFELHKKYKKPGKKIHVGYEKYGKDTDIEHIESEMRHRTYTFLIQELGGSMAKNDRIRRLIPDFKNGEILFPEKYKFVTYEGHEVDLIQTFIDEEYNPFPVGDHDDMLDGLARKCDMKIEFPMVQEEEEDYSIPDQTRV